LNNSDLLTHKELQETRWDEEDICKTNEKWKIAPSQSNARKLHQISTYIDHTANICEYSKHLEWDRGRK